MRDVASKRIGVGDLLQAGSGVVDGWAVGPRGVGFDDARGWVEGGLGLRGGVVSLETPVLMKVPI